MEFQKIQINKDEKRDIELEGGVNVHVERAYYSATTGKFRLTGWIYLEDPKVRRYCEIEGRISWNGEGLPTFSDIAQHNNWRGMTVVKTVKSGFKEFIENFYKDIKEAKENNEIIEIRTWEEYPQFKKRMGGASVDTFEYPGCKIARMKRPYGVTYFIPSTIFTE